MDDGSRIATDFIRETAKPLTITPPNMDSKTVDSSSTYNYFGSLYMYYHETSIDSALDPVIARGSNLGNGKLTVPKTGSKYSSFEHQDSTIEVPKKKTIK